MAKTSVATVAEEALAGGVNAARAEKAGSAVTEAAEAADTGKRWR